MAEIYKIGLEEQVNICAYPPRPLLQMYCRCEHTAYFHSNTVSVDSNMFQTIITFGRCLRCYGCQTFKRDNLRYLEDKANAR